MDQRPQAWTVRSSKYLSNEPPWWILREDHVVLPNGAEIERYWVSEYPTWCNVVAVTDANEVVLVEQYRHGIGEVHLELPGGVADHGSPLESARTELLEETGFGDGEWEPFMRICANPSLTNNWTYTFLARGVRQIAEPSHEATEDLRIHLVPVAELADRIDRGEIVQALHVGPLLRYALRM